jgi:hypothetical protein
MPVWSGHSCPLPLTLFLILTLTWFLILIFAFDPALTFRETNPKSTLVIPNRAEGPVRNPLLTLIDRSTNPCPRKTGKGTSSSLP